MSDLDFTCPVCGYPDLYEPAYSRTTGSGSYDICPSCGFQFGVSDDDLHYSFESWRANWQQKGYPWNSVGIPCPKNWDPIAQLRNITAIN